MNYLPIVLPVAGSGLLAAIVYGIFVLLGKRMEYANSVEQQHSSAREAAYEKILAACDFAWHFRVQSSLSDALNDYDPPEGEADELGNKAQQQLGSGLEDLRCHSQNPEKAEKTIWPLAYHAFERQRLAAEKFEDARAIVLELLRKETGLRESIRSAQRVSFWKHFQARRKYKRLLARINVMQDVENEVSIYQTADGEDFMALLNQFMGEWGALKESATRQDQRASHWRRRGLWPG